MSTEHQNTIDTSATRPVFLTHREKPQEAGQTDYKRQKIRLPDVSWGFIDMVGKLFP